MAKIQELYQDSLLFLGAPSRELDADLFLFFYLLFFFPQLIFKRRSLQVCTSSFRALS